MKERLRLRDTVLVGSMLFGLFFGAGNLIFPVYLGQMAGRRVWIAAVGLLITGVGLPLLGVAAQGISRVSGLRELAGKVGPRYGLLFTCALYLTIGPLFAIPRCASVSFTVGLEPMGLSGGVPLAVFSFLFFAATLAFSLWPGKILTWVGADSDPGFSGLSRGADRHGAGLPMGSTAAIDPQPIYAEEAFFSGFLEGYNTMDALASLAFGIVVIGVIRELGIKSPAAVAAKYRACRRGGLPADGGDLSRAGGHRRPEPGRLSPRRKRREVLALVANHYFGPAGGLILAATVTLACLKTAVGLITSCAETFSGLFPPGGGIPGVCDGLLRRLFPDRKPRAEFGDRLFAAGADVPLSAGHHPDPAGAVRQSVRTGPAGLRLGDRCTMVAAIFDLIKALPAQLIAQLHLEGLIDFAAEWLPLFSKGMGWVVPALIGLVIGLALHRLRPEDKRAKAV